MAGVKISNLSTVTPLSTDLVVLDRPATGPGAPVTGKATLASLATAIGDVTSGTFNEPSPAEFVTTASLSVAGAQGLVYTAGQVGADTYFFVSGAIGGKNGLIPAVGVFGGDLHVSGNLTVEGAYPSGGGGGGDQYWFSTQNLATYTTSSALFRGPAGTNNSPNDFGPDIFFFVSGTKASKETAVTGTAVFGGDAVISGSYYLGVDGGRIIPNEFGIPLTQVGLMSTNLVDIKRSSYSVIESSYGIGFEANTYCSARSSYYTSFPFFTGYGVYQSNYCTVDSTQISTNHAHQFSNYCSTAATDGGQTAGSSYCLIAASSDASGPAINGSAYSTTIATSDPLIQGFSRSAIIGGNNNLLNAGTGFPSLNSSVILGGKNWTIQEGDTIAMGAASGGSTRLLVSASAGMYLGGNLQVTGNIAVSQLMSIGQSLQVIGLMGVTGSAEFLGGVTGSLHYSASNAVDWNNNAPATIAEALNRIAAFINSNIGPIT